MFFEVYPQVLGVSTLKYCPKCETYYPATVEYFHSNARSRDGFAFRCKECAKLATREWNDSHRERTRENAKRWNEANPDRVKANNAAYHAANRDRLLPKYRKTSREWYINNKERRRKTAQEWRKANPERRRAKDREWALAHPENAREASKKWRRANPDKVREHDHRRRARLLSAEGSHTAADLVAIRAAQTDAKGRLICAWCHKPITDTPHLDHWIPLDKGGSNDAGNLRYMHAVCNLKKGAKHPHDLGRLL